MTEQVGIKLPVSKAEAKNDTTNRIARQIIDGEVAARDAKTDRLRAARMAREAAEQDAVVAAAAKKPKAKATRSRKAAT